MAQLKCDICGGTLIGLEDGVFQCENCGVKYSVESVRAKFDRQKGKRTPGGNRNTIKTASQNEVTDNPEDDVYLTRAFLSLEDGEWEEADGFLENALNSNPRNARAYLGKLMGSLHIRTVNELKNLEDPLENNRYYSKIIRFADEEFKAKVEEYNQSIKDRNEKAKEKEIYLEWQRILAKASTEKEIEIIVEKLEAHPDYEGSKELIEQCKTKAEECRKNEIYIEVTDLMKAGNIGSYGVAIKKLKTIPGWKDADGLLVKCNWEISKLKEKEAIRKLEEEKRAEVAKIEAEKEEDRKKFEDDRNSRLQWMASENDDTKTVKNEKKISISNGSGFFTEKVAAFLGLHTTERPTTSEKDISATEMPVMALLEKGDAQAQYQMGENYYYGDGVEQNYEKAVKWYQKAANQGHADAQNNLGICYKLGNGMKRDYEKAVKWYQKAVDQGHAVAQYNLGLCYFYGDGVEQNYEAAVKLFQKAANQGDPCAQVWLGYSYENGYGVEQDYKETVKWYQKAANQGNAKARNWLDEYYKNGGAEKK